MVGDIKAIDDAISALKNIGLVLKVMEELQDYSSCEIKFVENKKWTWLEQLHLIKNKEKKFGKCIQHVWSHVCLNFCLLGIWLTMRRNNSACSQVYFRHDEAWTKN